ncbi:MAG: c-type cytochrome [Saprospirales bacterium]|nr:c-type cytochrome [Saprospirales bacterium]MBK8491155.1 c-type cytochrome [Saprospirales bacterium]
MTRIFTSIACILFIVACGNNTPPDAAGTQSESTQPTDITMHPDYEPGLALVVANDCYNCHKVEDNMIGPPYQEIAKKYAGDAAAMDMLAEKIMTGGSGNWVVDTVMTPHPTVTKEDAVKIVKYIMLLKE